MKPRTYGWLLTLVVAGLVTALLLEWRTRRDLAGQVSWLARRNADLQTGLTQATRRASDLEKRAITLDSQLGSAKSRTTATESRHVQLARELTETKSLLTEREQREVALMAELAEVRGMMPGAKPTVAPATPPQPPAPEPAVDAGSYERRMGELEQQLTELLTRALAESAPEPVPGPAPVQATPPQVVRVGPQDAFVVIAYGLAQGARPGDYLALRRGTAGLARVQISDARPHFSLAQVLPDTLKGQLQTGDLVVLEN